jgi:hypothetical protein
LLKKKDILGTATAKRKAGSYKHFEQNEDEVGRVFLRPSFTSRSSTSEAVLTELFHLVGARFNTRTANERAGKTLNFTKH